MKETFLPIGRLREEFNKLYEYLEALDSPIVFSHNDLLLGNVIYTQSLNTVNFIDYEYADYNFQAFDIGNHFAEMCGVDEVDYSRYPKREFQLQWLRVYLEEYLQRSNIQNDEVELLYVQVNQFALASHIFWTVWSLLQAEHSTIDFDYVGCVLHSIWTVTLSWECTMQLDDKSFRYIDIYHQYIYQFCLMRSINNH